jgi:hypothetical protein
MAHNIAYDAASLEPIFAALNKTGLHERAGDLCTFIGRHDEALQAYRKGHAYR